MFMDFFRKVRKSFLLMDMYSTYNNACIVCLRVCFHLFEQPSLSSHSLPSFPLASFHNFNVEKKRPLSNPQFFKNGHTSLVCALIKISDLQSLELHSFVETGHNKKICIHPVYVFFWVKKKKNPGLQQKTTLTESNIYSPYIYIYRYICCCLAAW